MPSGRSLMQQLRPTSSRANIGRLCPRRSVLLCRVVGVAPLPSLRDQVGFRLVRPFLFVVVVLFRSACSLVAVVVCLQAVFLAFAVCARRKEEEALLSSYSSFSSSASSADPLSLSLSYRPLIGASAAGRCLHWANPRWTTEGEKLARKLVLLLTPRAKQPPKRTHGPQASKQRTLFQATFSLCVARAYCKTALPSHYISATAARSALDGASQRDRHTRSLRESASAAPAGLALHSLVSSLTSPPPPPPIAQ